MSTTAIPTGGETQVEPEAQEAPVAATATARKIFKYSEFVDLGEGAAECEHARDGECEDTSHFHAWCRIPNRYQDDDIRSKALAAKARRIRAMNDPGSDLAVVLDAEMEPLHDERFAETLIDELINEDLANDYIEAQTDVREREEYEHIQQDQEEFERLRDQEESLPQEEQSDEFQRLRDHIQGYLTAITDRLKEVQEPKRIEMRQRPFESLFGEVKAKRVEQEGSRAFMQTYNAWTCYVGTFQPQLHETLRRPYQPRWSDIGQRDRPEAGAMFDEDRDVLDALEKVFADLRAAFRQGSTGN